MRVMYHSYVVLCMYAQGCFCCCTASVTYTECTQPMATLKLVILLMLKRVAAEGICWELWLWTGLVLREDCRTQKRQKEQSNNNAYWIFQFITSCMSSLDVLSMWNIINMNGSVSVYTTNMCCSRDALPSYFGCSDLISGPLKFPPKSPSQRLYAVYL